MRFLVTGCSGFIGSRLTSSLLEQGHAVRGLVLPKEKGVGETLVELGMELWVGDVLNPETMDGIGEDIDVVYHLAGKHSGSVSRMRQPVCRGDAESAGPTFAQRNVWQVHCGKQWGCIWKRQRLCGR